MIITRTLLLVSLSLILASCISFPKTADEFRTSKAGALEFTVDQSLHVSYELIAGNTIRCHQGDTSHMSLIGSSFIVFPTGQTRVEGILGAGNDSATITVTYTNVASSGLLQVIDLTAVSESATQVTVHRLNDTKKWISATDAVKKWFEGSSECYEMW